MKRFLAPVAAGAIALTLGLSACGDDDSSSAVKDQVSNAVGSAVSAAKDAATNAACTSLAGVQTKLKDYENPTGEKVAEMKTTLQPLVNTLGTALTALGDKLPGEVSTKVTDAQKQLDEAFNEADGTKAAEKAGAAVKNMESAVTGAQSSLGCS